MLNMLLIALFCFASVQANLMRKYQYDHQKVYVFGFQLVELRLGIGLTPDD